MTKRNTKKQSKPQVIDVEFAINAPEAKIVCLAGSFNQWCPESLPLQRNGDGPWRIKLPLPAGRHEYKFVVDGNWIHDPKAAETCANSCGSLNSTLEVK
jgi:1,4-alpha-glucan branching enzyme